MPHSKQYRSFQRWSSQPITWLILTNKTVQEITDKQTQYKIRKVNNLKYSKTKLPWFSCLLQHLARKRSGLILQRSRAHTGQTGLSCITMCGITKSHNSQLGNSLGPGALYVPASPEQSLEWLCTCQEYSLAVLRHRECRSSDTHLTHSSSQRVHRHHCWQHCLPNETACWLWIVPWITSFGTTSFDYRFLAGAWPLHCRNVCAVLASRKACFPYSGSIQPCDGGYNTHILAYCILVLLDYRYSKRWNVVSIVPIIIQTT